MGEKERRRFYLPFIESPIPLFELKCWECGNKIVFGEDERGYYVEEASELVFEPPLTMKARLAEKPGEAEMKFTTEELENLITEMERIMTSETWLTGNLRGDIFSVVRAAWKAVEEAEGQ